MQRLPFLVEEQASTDAARDACLDFNSFDGVVVHCGNHNGSRKSWPPWCWSSSANEIVGTVYRRGMEDASHCSARDQPCLDSTSGMLRDPNGSTTTCMSSLGIHMCDCPHDSIHCNLSTPLDGGNRPLKPSTGWSLQKDPPSSPLQNPNYLHDHYRVQSPSRTHEGHTHYRRDSSNGCGAKSPLSAWAAVLSDSCSCPSIPTAGSVGTLSYKKGVRVCSQYGEQPPTFASRLELTGAALDQCKSDSGYGGWVGRDLAMPPSPLRAVVQRELMKLKLDPKTLSISEPAPYGTLHGILHCTFSEGLPNYTFLLDDYDEVITAKLWMEDMVLGSEHGAWRYSFYSLRGETRRKSKTGWKYWSRKEKLTSMLVAKMKVVSALCVDENQEFSVKSECILYETRADDPTTMKQVVASTLTRSAPSETESWSCSSPSTTSMGASNVPSTISSPSATASPGPGLQAFISPSSLAGAEIVQKTQKRSLWSRLPNIQMKKTGKADVVPKNPGVNAHSNDSLTDDLAWSHLKQLEIAAIIMGVPLEVKDRQAKVQEQQRQASITVILPSGNHGGPLSEVNGPSPLISRWKEGGRCDCKGWDLGCGLTILTNSWQKEEAEAGGQGEPLKFYKQDADHEDALLSIAPKANGLVALEYRAPLSPLQAFAIAVAILHGRNSKVPRKTSAQLPDVKGSYLHYGPPKDEDGPFDDDVSASKVGRDKDAAGLVVNSGGQQLHDMPFVKIGQAPELGHSLERV